RWPRLDLDGESGDVQSRSGGLQRLRDGGIRLRVGVECELHDRDAERFEHRYRAPPGRTSRDGDREQQAPERCEVGLDLTLCESCAAVDDLRLERHMDARAAARAAMSPAGDVRVLRRVWIRGVF